MSENPADAAVGNTIIRGGVLRLVAFGYSAVLGVVATAVISRAVGPHGFAEYVTAMSLISIAMSFSDVGLLALGLREFAAQSGSAQERSLRALITLRLALSIVCAIAVVIFAVLVGYSTALVTGLSLAGVGIVFLSLHASYTVPIQGTFQLNVVAGLEALRQTLVMGMMIAAALGTGSIGAVIATYLPAAIAIAFATAIFARRISSIVPSLDFPEMRQLLRHVGTFAIAATIGSTYGFFAQVVSNTVLPKDESGLFALAFRVFAVLVGAGYTAISGAFPLLVAAVEAGDRERYDYAVRRLLQVSILAGLICTVGLVTGADFVTLVLGGSDFSGADTAVAVVGLALPSSFIVLTGASALLAARRHVHLVAIALIGASASIAATAALAAQWGTVGAATGIVVGETVLAAGYLWGIGKVSPRALPRASWAVAVLAAGALCCASALLPASGLVCALIGLALFAGIVIFSGLIPPELKQNAQGVLGRLTGRD